MPRRGLRALLLATTTLVGLAAPDAVAVAPVAPVAAAPVAAVDRPSPGSPGLGDPYFPFDGNGGIDVTHYGIHDAYDLASGRLHGHTTLDLTATEHLSRFDLDFLLPVTRVTVAGRRAGFERRGDHELVITPRHPLPAGAAVRVRVDYDGHPECYRDRGRHWLADSHEVVAMNEPHMAAWWFPSDDHPRDKASYDISVTVARSLRVVANGELVARRVHAGSRGATATTHWRETDPMASYLAFFAAGDFEVRRGVDTAAPDAPAGRPWYVAVSRRLPERRRRGDLRAMLRTPAITDWLASVLGPYPFDSTGGLVTSLDPGFALENQTRPTFPSFNPRNITLVVHELTHQWFGDSVSVRDWRDIWVNEGFAQWMQSYWRETHGGASAATWLRDRYAFYAARPDFWRQPVADPGPRELFSLAVYDRGAMAVQALRQRLGDPVFFTLLRTWVADHRHGDGSVRQFERLAHTVSGQRLGGFFRAWLVAPRAPARTAANGLA